MRRTTDRPDVVTRHGETLEGVDRRVASLERLRDCLQREMKYISEQMLAARAFLRGAVVVFGALLTVVAALLGVCVWVFLDQRAEAKETAAKVIVHEVVLERVTTLLESQERREERQERAIERSLGVRK